MQSLNRDYWQKTFANLATAFENEKVALCQMDGVIGDGDHGASMARGFAEALAQFPALGDSPEIAAMFSTTGNAFLGKVGGVTGVIFGTFFIEAGKKAEGLPETDPGALTAMLDAALQAIKKRGKVQEGDKSMIDALAPAVDALKERIENGSDWKEILEALAESARQGSEATRPMAAKVGRVRYQKEKGVGHVDPGSVSVAIFFRTLKESLA
ncbi:MAG: dihydroxyacetone kinase subunit L [Pirellulales bacterium]|nr:dihydroxyacetone kinase subunit L [Pirellulales bacterium]